MIIIRAEIRVKKILEERFVVEKAKEINLYFSPKNLRGH